MKKLITVLLVISMLLAVGMLAACEETPTPANDATGTPSGSNGSSSGSNGSSSGSNASSGGSGSSGSSSGSASVILDEWVRTYTAGNYGIVNPDDPFVLLEIEGYGDIRLELFPQYAPITVENFLRYVEDGFYDGMVFHRVIASFMIQAGGFEERNGVAVQKAATYPNIKGEFVSNGVENYLGHFPGVLSMARGNDPDSGSSQFFICTARASWCDGSYAAFGRVIDEESMAVVLAIEKVQTGSGTLYYGNVPVTSSDVPTTLPKIRRATVVKRGKAGA